MTSKSYPINCSRNASSPYRVANIGLDRVNNPHLMLWCKRCSTEHTCRLEQLLQSWRGIMAGNELALLAQLVRLRKAVGDIEADLEDLRLQKEVG